MTDILLIIGVATVIGLYYVFSIPLGLSAAIFIAMFCIYLLFVRWSSFTSIQKIAISWLIVGCLFLAALFAINNYDKPIDIPYWYWVLVVLPPGLVLAKYKNTTNHEAHTNE